MDYIAFRNRQSDKLAKHEKIAVEVKYEIVTYHFDIAESQNKSFEI